MTSDELRAALQIIFYPLPVAKIVHPDVKIVLDKAIGYINDNYISRSQARTVEEIEVAYRQAAVDTADELAPKQPNGSKERGQLLLIQGLIWAKFATKLNLNKEKK